MTWQVRRARVEDMAAVAEIINAHIESGWAHFGDRPTSTAEWVADWEANAERYPWLVAERDGTIGGLAWAKTFNPRAAYRWTAEVSIYLRPGLEGRGLGTRLYGRLIPTLDEQGYRCLISGITTPNPGSVRLHERFGFHFLGSLERVGYKLGAWHNVGSWQRLVGPMDDSEPAPVRTVGEVWPGD